MLLGILSGIAIAAVLSLLVILHAGMALFLDILLPGMLLGAIVGFANTAVWSFAFNLQASAK